MNGGLSLTEIHQVAAALSRDTTSQSFPSVILISSDLISPVDTLAQLLKALAIASGDPNRKLP